MGIFASKQFNSLHALVVDQICDLYDAEHRLVDALPKMADAAKSPELKSAFESHLRETEQHVLRLERIFELLNESPKRETCEAMKGLIAEGKEVLDAEGDEDVLDAALIGAAQRVEHYEIASYGTARDLIRRLGLAEAANLLQQTLDEEGAADKTLTSIAITSVNPQAA